jgi:hypothetical protein
MQGFQDTFQAVQGADRCQDMGRISSLGATRLDPAPGFAGRQERIEQALGGFMGEQALTKIV